MSMNKKQPHIKWMFQLSRGAVRSMATQGIGHSKLKQFLDAIPTKPKVEEDTSAPLPTPIKKFKGVPPSDGKKKVVKRKGSGVSKKKKGVVVKAGKKRGRPPKRKS